MGVDVSFNFKGYPEACYVGQVGKSLNLDRDHAINLGLPGVMSKDMLELVKTGTMAEMNTLSGCQYNYPEFVDYIKSADVISIQLGSNDAFVPTVVSFGEATNWKSEDLASIVLSGNLRGNSKETEDCTEREPEKAQPDPQRERCRLEPVLLRHEQDLRERLSRKQQQPAPDRGDCQGAEP